MKQLRRAVSVLISAAILLSTGLFVVNSGATSAPYDENKLQYTVKGKSYDTFVSENKAGKYQGDIIRISAKDCVFSKDSDVEITDYIGNKNIAVWKSQTGKMDIKVSSPEKCYYQLGFVYSAIPDDENKIVFSVAVNGTVQYSEADSLSLPRIWKNEGEIKTLSNNDQISPLQVQAKTWYSTWLKDINGVYNEPLGFLLEKGENTITVSLSSGSLAIDEIFAGTKEQSKAYSDYIKTVDTSKVYDGEPILIKAQDAVYKTGKELRPISDSSSPSLTPQSPYVQKINAIGGSSWASAGSKLIWNFTVKETACYALNFKFLQSSIPNGSAVRSVEIDGEVPFSELEAVTFDYGLNWQIKEMKKGEKPYLVYLEKGDHTISMEVVLGPFAKSSRELQDIVYDLGELYRELIMITGTYPDKNRDYRLTDQIPDLMSRLKSLEKRLIDCKNEINAVSGKKGGSNAVVLENMAADLKLMQKSAYTVQKYIQDYFSNYCSVASYVYSMRQMSLTVSGILLTKPEDKLSDYKDNFFEKAIFSVKRFINSFVRDYSSVGDKAENSKEEITVWVNCGRDQAHLLSELIRNSFSSDSDIGVNLRISAASIVQGTLAGRAPDIALTQARATPVNMALRNVLCNLEEFSDFNEVKQNFMENALVPYMFENGTYGLPETQNFQVMFCRNDILHELGIDPPDTWDELLEAASVIMRNNMMVGIPYTQVTDSGQVNTGIGALNIYPCLLNQAGGSLYNEDLTGTMFSSNVSKAVFNKFISFYKDYRFPVTYDFYNRFRTGEMPMAIGNYTLYSQLSAAAPEIRGLWSIYLVPGTVREDGTFDRTVTDSGSACVLLKSSEHKEASWKFLKWWVSNETQSSYSSQIESVLGVAGRNPTANVAAFQSLSWEREDEQQILKQWKYVDPVPEVAGGYFTQRVIDNAFWLAYNQNEIPNDVLSKWSKMADEEIQRKRDEYRKEKE